MNLQLADWRKLWNAAGARGKADELFLTITERYSEPTRHYHNGEHIAECLREFDKVRTNIEADLNEIEMALWLHDVIYDPKKSDNEEQSANFADSMLRGAALSDRFRNRVRELILVTRHNAIPDDASARFLVDIDLSILGQSAERFWRYEADIRKEYAFVPEEFFRTKRAEILEKFLERRKIYQTEFFAHAYEQRARENLTESLRRLRS